MKRLTLIISLLILITPYDTSAKEHCGIIISAAGTVTKTNINCPENDCSSKNNEIFPGERIITGKGSKAEILLKEGTAIILYDNSDLIINRIRERERDKPTLISLETGKIKIIQKNSFLDTSLIIRTPVSIIKSVKSELSIITADNETALFVYTGEAGFASSNSSVVDAFILNDGEESLILKDSPPSKPLFVKRILRDSWLYRFLLSKDRKRVLKYKKNSGIADWPFISSE